MLDIPSVTTAGRINSIVTGFLKGSQTIEPNRDLRERGLTSMDMVNLMLSIEAEFDITIPSQKLIPANFTSIENIAALLRELGR